jgi:transposase
MSKPKPNEIKRQALEQHASLNPRPQTVTDPLFQENNFFDPQDLVQVKYEMLRRVRVDGLSVKQASSDFGFSRPSFYQAQSAFEREGAPGLVPRKRGPHQAHKLTGEVLAFLVKARTEQPELGATALAHLLDQQFGLRIHPRTIERGFERQRKKAR